MNETDKINEESMAIADMQSWVFRKAQTRWHKTPAECVEIFQKYDLLGFIAECYGLLHLSSYDHALVEVEEILKSHGVKI